MLKGNPASGFMPVLPGSSGATRHFLARFENQS
jgi:hypothetical protein